MDVEEDEHGESENLQSDSDHEMAPPTALLGTASTRGTSSASRPVGAPGPPVDPQPTAANEQ